MMLAEHAPFMRQAIALAQQYQWRTFPNPTVGALLVQDGKVVAQGCHHKAGEAHAEINCLEDARKHGVDPTTCTLYVTLEPCNHHGKTPPCTDALLASGIRHVVIGLRDPNPKAAGGLEKLRAAGIQVTCGVLEQECEDLIADFLAWQNNRPYVILKMASTLDGRIATRTGESRWISSEASRHQVHEMRAAIAQVGGAILVGGATLRIDNPALTARLDNYQGVQPLACILTTRLPVSPDDVTIVRERPEQSIFFTTPAEAASPTALMLREKGVHIIPLQQNSENTAPDFASLFQYLWEQHHCPYVLCEGGGKLGLSLLACAQADAFHLHMAPLLLGDNEARPLFDGRAPMTLAEGLPLRIHSLHTCGTDIHLILRPR